MIPVIDQVTPTSLGGQTREALHALDHFVSGWWVVLWMNECTVQVVACIRIRPPAYTGTLHIFCA